MLTEEAIRRALHASRVVPLGVDNPHGPLGLEQLAAAVARRTCPVPSGQPRIRRAIDLPLETWERLEQLAAEASRTASSRVHPSELAATIIEEYLTSTR
jgi:hypothetical protein